jgi:hypothetical protein
VTQAAKSDLRFINEQFSHPIATIKISVRILLKSKGDFKGHLNAKVLHNSNKSIQKDKQVIKD